MNAFEVANNQKSKNILVILTGPTGAGKDTVMDGYLAKYPDAVHLITTNSRPMRDGEIEGKDYYFVSRDEFEKLIAEDGFIEWVEYLGHYKGGQKKHVEEALKSGKDVIWRIDVRGMKNVRQKAIRLFKNVLIVMIVPESIAELEKRIRDRRAADQLTEEVMKTSVALANWEVEQTEDCDYVLLNATGKEAETMEKLRSIIEAKRQEVEK
ncbi:MAG: AAA family ATPase [Patescibacteria group bacterium]